MTKYKRAHQNLFPTFLEMSTHLNLKIHILSYKIHNKSKKEVLLDVNY